MNLPSAAAAGTRKLGDLDVNRLGFGCMRLTGREAFHGGEPRDRQQSIAVLRRAVELGVNHLDTAGFYFSRLRSANELINTALAPYPDGLVIATKVGPSRDAAGEFQPFATPEQLRGQVEENLRQLGRDHLDLVNLRMYSREHSVAEHLEVLAAMREEGLIRHLGLSNVGVPQLTEARAITPVVCVQNRYALDSRREGDDEVLRVCGELGVAFVPFFAIAGEGKEGGAADAEREVNVLAVAQAHGASPAQVRLAWSLQQGSHVLAIPGTGSVDHLEENVAAAALRLTGDELALLG